MGEIDKERMRKELKEFLPIRKPEGYPISADVPIIFDGRQYSIRIPKKIVDALQIDVKKDRFYFQAFIPHQYADDNTPTLKGELKRG